MLLNYNGQMWPEQVRKDFVEYVRGGGGVVAIHAANNSFDCWKEYEQMVGLCGRTKQATAPVAGAQAIALHKGNTG